MQQNLDLGVGPVEALLGIADILDRLARQLFDVGMGDAAAAAHFAGDHDAVGGAQRFGRDARARITCEICIDDRIGNAVANLVRMPFGDGFAGEQIIGIGHGDFLSSPSSLSW